MKGMPDKGQRAEEQKSATGPRPGLRQLAVWTGALVAGTLLGLLRVDWLEGVCEAVATVYTRLFQLVAVPTIALAITTTLLRVGGSRETGRTLVRTLTYTLLTTLAAALVGLALFVVVHPANLPAGAVTGGGDGLPAGTDGVWYRDHLLGVVPNNAVEAFREGNVLSVLLLSAAVGLALAFMPKDENVQTLIRGIRGMQALLFRLIRGLVWTLPLGIVAFAAQLSAQVEAGIMVGSLGRYVAVILGGNLVQSLVVLPLFLCSRGLNPWRVLRAMWPAVVMALFTKSSAATLPLTMQSAEQRLGARPEVARFVLPICTTINMNGCAAFILVTSLFVMQNGGTPLTVPTLLLWTLIAVVAAVGNAGVPMGCYFLTLSLMAGIGAPVGIMGLVLPVFTVVDMVETAENVWSDSCVCAMVDHDKKR